MLVASSSVFFPALLLPSFTEFFQDFDVSSSVLYLSLVLPSFTEFYRVLPSFTEFFPRFSCFIKCSLSDIVFT